MELHLDSEQRQLIDSVDRFLADQYSFERRSRYLLDRAGYDSAIWSEMATLGLLAVPMDARYGGFGFGAADMFALLQSFGGALLLEPYVQTAAACRAIAEGLHPSRAGGLLQAAAAGQARFAVADQEPGGGFAVCSTTAVRTADGWRLSGRKCAVVGAPSADAILTVARVDDGLALFLVPTDAPGVSLQPYRMFDGHAAADVALSDVRIVAEDRLGKSEDGSGSLESLRDYFRAMLCAEATGALQSACDDTLAYLKTRRQFGTPLATFQALQHRLVEMFMQVEQVRSISLLACDAVDTGAEVHERGRIVSAACIHVADVCRHVAQEAIQLHGGMGLTEELKISHTFRRLTSLPRLFGDSDYHLARFASLDNIANAQGC